MLGLLKLVDVGPMKWLGRSIPVTISCCVVFGWMLASDNPTRNHVSSIVAYR